MHANGQTAADKTYHNQGTQLKRTKRAAENPTATLAKPERRAQNVCKTVNKGTALQGKSGKQAPIFHIGTKERTNPRKLVKYEWHFILNHASSEVLTRLARNSKLNIPSPKQLSAKTADKAYRGCLEGKLKRALHKRKEHGYGRGEAVRTYIMGPLNIPGMPAEFK